MASGAELRVLVLDGELRHAVGIVRALGRHGIPVVVAGDGGLVPARFSRYAERAVAFRSDREGAPDALLTIAEKHHVDVVIAAGLPGNELLCRHRARLEPHVRAPFNDADAFERLSNKQATVQFADSLGVPHPRTIELRDPGQAKEVIGALGVPVVFKSPLDQGTVRYARAAGELETLDEEFRASNRSLVERGLYPIAQQYVEGDGHGFYALADHGRIVAWFMHRRLHEFPPSGGPSAMAVSYRDPELLDLGRRFIAETRWHGVAMVEFKRRRADGEYFLIEVNPKFWGSLDLSIACGVNFPLLLHRMLTGAPIDHSPGDYADGRIFRWLTMDLAYAVAAHRVGTYVRTFWDPRVQDDFARDDPLPSAVLMLKGVGQFRARRSAVRAS